MGLPRKFMIQIGNSLVQRATDSRPPTHDSLLRNVLRILFDLAGFGLLTIAGFTVSSLAGYIVAGLSCFLLGRHLTAKPEPTTNTDPMMR